jgi:stage IV sporulation protein B
MYLHENSHHSFRLTMPISLSVRSDKADMIKINGRTVSNNAFRLDLTSPISMQPVGLGEVNLEFRLFGWIPVRRVTVDVIPYMEVIPGGEAIGVLLAPEGLLVTGFEAVFTQNGQRLCPAREKGIQVGDIVLDVDGQQIFDRMYFEILLSRIGEAGKEAHLRIRRGKQILNVPVKPVQLHVGRGAVTSSRGYSIGLVVSDNAAGVGTLTFIHSESKRYGALGHVIMDPKTKRPLEINDGRIVQASISAIHQGQRGQPGEKMGTFQGKRDVVGSIDTNTDFGIYGTMYEGFSAGQPKSSIPIALAHDIHPGPAQIMTVLQGHNVEVFDVEIQQVLRQNGPDGKGLVLHVTDKRLLSVTGGIIQGMSGSPIIQNGRLAGAVTHVFVNDPTRGYGVLAEWMIIASGILDGGVKNVLSAELIHSEQQASILY